MQPSTATLSPTTAPGCNPDAGIEENSAPPLRLSRPLRDLLRLILRLARRTGFCFARVAKLAQMLGKCERSIRYGLRKLLELGCIERQFDGRHLFLRPLTDLPEPDPTPRPRRPFSRPAVAALIAGPIAGLKAKSCRSAPYKETDFRNNNKPPGRPPGKPPGHGVVSSSAASADPGILAQAQAAVKAYAERHPVRSRGALLAAAIKGRWQPPAPVSEYPSDRNERPVRLVTAPPGWQLGASRAGNAPPGAQEPCRAVPGLSPVSSSAVSSPGLAAILARCEARRGARA